MNGIDEMVLDKVCELLSDCEKYLHSWVCTRTGEYEPMDTRNVRAVLMQLVAGGSKNPIHDFKKGVEEGTILFPTNCVGLLEHYRKELYDKHKENIEEFEKKYNIKNETD